uniref:ZNF71_1 protein n=1 Tax=Fopius arisanus TaxID=64838 RepID=A0A0C9QDN1_9HYME
MMQSESEDVMANNTESLSDCNICGRSHGTHECPFLLDLQYVPDTPMLSKARQTLPPGLEITKMADGTISILTKREFLRGTTFGPFEAKRNWTMNPVTNFPIRIFGTSPAETYHLDYSNEDNSNWMCFIAPASCAKEQNLICYQVKSNIFYTAMRTIISGEELRVWYAPFYALKMKMPLYNVDFASLGPSIPSQNPQVSSIDSKTNQIEILNKDMAQKLAERLPAQQLGAKDNKAVWKCKICTAIMNSVPSYAKHLMEHYKLLLGAFCNICNRKFYNNSVLQKHKVEKHSEFVTEAIGIPTSENHRQQNAQMILLNMSETEGQNPEAIKEILEKLKIGKTTSDSSIREIDKDPSSDLHLLDTNSINVNELFQNSNFIDNSSLKSILENQCLNINLSSMTDSILSDNISPSDPVKFHVEEITSELLEMANDSENISQRIDNLDCDICGKKFDKPEYLYRHLRKHTGEFICPACLAVFARKENLMSHVCSYSKRTENFECPYCQKQFTVKKYLKRHMTKHFNKNNCKWCRKTFPSQLELDSHKCPAPRHVCPQCGKRFVHRAHLIRHAKLHNNPKPLVKTNKTIKKKSADQKPLICEKCGISFKTSYILNQHLRSHGERTFECDICQRRFHRISVLKQHRQIHENAQIPCNVCGKKLKSKKALDVHVLLHGNKKFQCEKCDKSFFQRCNYLKHFKQIHGEKTMYKCPHCPTQFTSENSYSKHVETHLKPAEYCCGLCQKKFSWPVSAEETYTD